MQRMSIHFQEGVSKKSYEKNERKCQHNKSRIISKKYSKIEGFLAFNQKHYNEGNIRKIKPFSFHFYLSLFLVWHRHRNSFVGAFSYLSDITYCGIEQRQLARLIIWRSLVQIQLPQPNGIFVYQIKEKDEQL